MAGRCSALWRNARPSLNWLAVHAASSPTDHITTFPTPPPAPLAMPQPYGPPASRSLIIPHPGNRATQHCLHPTPAPPTTRPASQLTLANIRYICRLLAICSHAFLTPLISPRLPFFHTCYSPTAQRRILVRGTRFTFAYAPQQMTISIAAFIVPPSR